MTLRADVAIVGGGSGGCVAAARLSDDPGRRVLLIEEGPDPRPIPELIADPARQPEILGTSPYVRRYPVARPNGSTFDLFSGLLLGGGSSVNNMGVVRPFRRDFEAWARVGGPAWSYDALLPLLTGLEDDPDFEPSPIHGRGGPLKLVRAWTPDRPIDPATRAMLDTAAELGIPFSPDTSVAEPYGLCASPRSTVAGRRQSAVNAFLDPVRDRPNLEVAAGTRAIRLVLDGARVRGVEVVGPAGPEVVEADRVVVAAGTYQTPHLLLHSGVGPVDVIQAVGLPVRHRLDGVGENLQDHAVVYMGFAVPDAPGESGGEGPGPEPLVPEPLVPRLRMVVASTPGMDHADLHVLVHPATRDGGRPLLPVSIRLIENRGRGHVRLRSADPTELPAVTPGVLIDPDDVAAVVNGMRLVARFMGHPRMARFYGDLVSPAAAESWAAHARSSYVTYNHGVGTCRLGSPSDPLAVVGPDLRVHGLENLWIADASVIPVIPHAATNLTANLVGAIAARNLAVA